MLSAKFSQFIFTSEKNFAGYPFAVKTCLISWTFPSSVCLVKRVCFVQAFPLYLFCVSCRDASDCVCALVFGRHGSSNKAGLFFFLFFVSSEYLAI